VFVCRYFTIIGPRVINEGSPDYDATITYQNYEKPESYEIGIIGSTSKRQDSVDEYKNLQNITLHGDNQQKLNFNVSVLIISQSMT